LASQAELTRFQDHGTLLYRLDVRAVASVGLLPDGKPQNVVS